MGARFIGSAGPNTTIFSFELIHWLLKIIEAFNQHSFVYSRAPATSSIER
jgi:hypothetical protein